MRYQPSRENNWRSWLATVAHREAIRLHGEEAGHIGFEVERDEIVREPADPRDVVALRTDLRAALDLLAAVPDRRRQVEALQVTGSKSEEIMQILGISYSASTVRRPRPTRR